MTVLRLDGRGGNAVAYVAAQATAGKIFSHNLSPLRNLPMTLDVLVIQPPPVQGLGAAGRMKEARAAIEEALDWSERSEERWYLAELLRINGELFQLDGSASAAKTAEDQYLQALEWARRQQALSWELRAATSLARLWHQQGRTTGADELLSSVYGRFSEGFETVDLKSARALIDDLHKTPA